MQRFQDIFSQICWTVYIGRIDILLEASFLLSYHVISRIGYLDQALHIFAYLKLHPKRKLGFDSEHPAIIESRLHNCDWSEFYRDASEANPGNKPLPRGNSMSTH